MTESGSVNQVPDVVGFDAVDACEMVRAAGLVPYGPQFEPAPATGVIVAQEPEPATGVEPAAAVVLWTEDRRADADLVHGPTSSASAEPA